MIKHKLTLGVCTLLVLFMTGCGVSSQNEINTDGSPLQGQPISEENLPISPSEKGAVEISSEEVLQSEEIVDQDAESISLRSMLKKALLPVGTTAYIWGGGWNEEDTAAGPEATTIGLSPRWAEFANAITSNYDHKKYRYQIHDGLDCSGYVGWVIYNTFETKDGREGYVMSSTDMASTFASYGWGDLRNKQAVTDWKPGDIASMKGHVWICLGSCEDGSVLLVHSSPPGVRICGTKNGSKTSEAVKLAASLMERFYPEWYQRFPDCEVSADYLKADQMRWNTQTLPDALELQNMTAEEIASLLFPE
ncbi:MAG: hypothetical protein J6Z22_05930 [Lachnospiraceae bacterium]|nr:hypothetical protein [Lachnospiraceae bacterium]